MPRCIIKDTGYCFNSFKGSLRYLIDFKALICWKQPKIELNMSKFPDSCTQNIDQVNLLVEFIRENNSNKNDNCSHNCQNISNKLMFDRMILNHLHINASNFWKLSKIWVMIELKNSNFKLHKCVSSPL